MVLQGLQNSFKVLPSLLQFRNTARTLSAVSSQLTCFTSQPPQILCHRRNYCNIHEPRYLKLLESDVPTCDLLNFQIRGYDFPVLEKYAKYVHRTAERMGIDVEDAWAVPSTKLRVTKLKPESTIVNNDYRLNVYERVVQLSDISATLLPVFVNVIEAALPAGVTLRIVPHTPEQTEIRYVPDFELNELKKQLDDILSSREKK